MKIKSIIKSLGISVFVILFPIISGIIVSVNKTETPKSILIQAISMLLSIIIAIIIIISKKISLESINIKFNQSKKNYLFYLPCLLVLVPLMIDGFIWKGNEYFWYTLLLYLCVGISEELYFRGFIIRILKPHFNTQLIIIISTLLFGIGHISTIFSRTDIITTLLIVFNALIFGLIAIELTLITKNIIPIMLIHFLFDFESKFITLSNDKLMICEFIRGAIMVIYAFILALYIRKNEKNNS